MRGGTRGIEIEWTNNIHNISFRNLSTKHSSRFYESRHALYKAFPPEEARRLAKRLEIHYTPKHGSWLDIAECELSVLTRQCLDRRIPDIDTLVQETQKWEQNRNLKNKTVDWRFTTDDARIKLTRLYPQFKEK